MVKLLHLTEVYHFHDMIDMLVKCGYKKGTTLFGYGYDFRQSNRYSIFDSSVYPKIPYLALVNLNIMVCSLVRTDKVIEGLKAKLETAYKASGNRKVNIISHSMGGILVLCFMSLHKDVRMLAAG